LRGAATSRHLTIHLEGHYSEVSFSEFGKFVCWFQEFEDGRTNKFRTFLGLGLMASGRRGLSIEEFPKKGIKIYL
jgi:hypothetical protein